MRGRLMRRGWRVGVVTALILVQTGCESAPKAGGMNQALADYNAQKFTQAHERAVAIQEKATRPGEREDAAYVAGLSAYQLGQTDEAERRLLVASRSANPQTSAKAKAMLGQIRLDQRRPREAAKYLTDAAPILTGEDASKAAYNASVAYQQAGNQTESKEWLARSGGRPTLAAAPPTSTPVTVASNASVRTTRPAASGNSATGFTLQVGAFKEKSRAHQAAADAQKLARRDGLGSVKIISRRDERGSMLYVVQFGWFPTRESATAARAKLGRLEYIVAPAPA
jgi:cell division protein FtsN